MDIHGNIDGKLDMIAWSDCDMRAVAVVENIPFSQGGSKLRCYLLKR
jgi:hypothetical protein